MTESKEYREGWDAQKANPTADHDKVCPYPVGRTPVGGARTQWWTGWYAAKIQHLVGS